MADFISVTPDFAVAPQIERADFARAAAMGFKTIISNRPDGETPGQLTAADAAVAAQAAGLTFKAIPFAGPPPAEAVSATAAFLGEASGPILAFCRSGTRSITVWAFAEVKSGRRTPDDVITLAAAAGYDLSPHRAALAQRA
ncbi:MAG: TIGR01244 family sulfur transferase [Hyphomonadaceae bacterium]